VVIGIYHLGTLYYIWLVTRAPNTIMPKKADIINAWQTFRFNLGFQNRKPKQGFYTFEEKIEYWALVWGTVIMVITGFFLWNPITTAKILPGAWIPGAKSAHGNEALLAVLAVLLWHSYHVLVKHFNTSMFTGYMSEQEMKEFHELTLVEPPFRPPEDDDPSFKKRSRWFSLSYGAASLIMLGVVYWSVTTEETASTVSPDILNPVEERSYVPLPPTPQPSQVPIGQASDLGRTWEGGLAEFFSDRCGTCHRAGGGIAHLDMETYRGVLTGGDSGPAVVPYYPGVSLAVVWFTKGEHPGNLSPEEIAATKIWILQGAPEK
jgi:hypothetical protein